MCTYSEKYKESLILFSHTVINPGTVVIHLPDASFTNTAGRREKMLMHDTLTLIMSSTTAPVYTQYAYTDIFKSTVWRLKEHVTF